MQLGLVLMRARYQSNLPRPSPDMRLIRRIVSLTFRMGTDTIDVQPVFIVPSTADQQHLSQALSRLRSPQGLVD